jgi:hypothetical protein
MALDLFGKARELGTPGRPSKLERLLDSLDDEARAEVIDFVWHDGADPELSHRKIAETLNDAFPDFGPFSLQQIQRHRAQPRPL